jgi:hypothetical protein
MSEYDIEKVKLEMAALRKFAAIQRAAEEKVCAQKIYIDMVDDLEAGLVLDELMFFTLPRPETGKSGLRVWKDGYLWMAVQRTDWWERKRLKPRQADRAIEKLEAKSLIVKAVYKFNGTPTTHLRLNVPEFFKQYGAVLDTSNPPESQEDTITQDLADLYEMMGLTENLPKVEDAGNGNHQMVISNSPNGEAKSPNGEILNNPHQPSHTTNGNRKRLPPISLGAANLLAIGASDEQVAAALDDEVQRQARMVDAANEIAKGGFGMAAPEAYAIALIFMQSMDVVIPKSQYKGQRAAIREMLDWGATAEHVKLALIELKRHPNLSIADLHSVKKQALAVKNKEASQPQTQASGFLIGSRFKDQ